MEGLPTDSDGCPEGISNLPGGFSGKRGNRGGVHKEAPLSKDPKGLKGSKGSSKEMPRHEKGGDFRPLLLDEHTDYLSKT